MKTVFSNSMVAHVWAQQNQQRGHNAGSSMSFDGPTLYSYRTPIAYIPDGAQFGLVALLTSETYSATTSSKHMPAARSAIAGRRTWRVPRLAVDKASLRTNGGFLEREYIDEIAQLLRSPAESVRLKDRTGEDAWPTYAHMVLNQMADNIADFRKTFDVPGPMLSWKESADQIIARRDRLLADPKRAAKREAGRVQREAAYARNIEAARLERLGRERTALERWNSGGIVYAYERLSDAQGGALLRVSPAGLDVQTSWGAAVPLRDAKRVLALYDLIMDGFDTRTRLSTHAGYAEGRGTWEPVENNESANVGHFRVTRIYQDGRIVIGCHTIFPAEIKSLRTKLV